MLLTCHNISKFYAEHYILKNVNFSLNYNSLNMLYGENGSGKSTFLKIMVGLISPSAGEITYAENNLNIAYLGHQTFLYPTLTVQENLEFWGKLINNANLSSKKPIDSYALNKSIEQCLKKVGLFAYAQEKTQTLSRGMAQRLNLARIILQKPKLLLLDEPETGLDSQGRELLYSEVVNQKKENNCIFWVSHDQKIKNEQKRHIDNIFIIKDKQIESS